MVVGSEPSVDGDSHSKASVERGSVDSSNNGKALKIFSNPVIQGRPAKPATPKVSKPTPR